MCCSRRKMTTKMLIRRTATMIKSTGSLKSKKSIIIKNTSTSKITKTSKTSIDPLMSRISKHNLNHSQKLLTTPNNTASSMPKRFSKAMNRTSKLTDLS